MVKATKKKGGKRPAKKAKAKAKPAKKPAKKAVKKPAPKPAKKKPAPKPAPVREELEAPSLRELSGRAMIVQIVGDAEAYFFDFPRLSAARRAEIVAHHLAAYDRRKQAEGKADWHVHLVPIALLGESMPPPVRKRFDLSAPHEGVVLHHAESGALLYAASKDDDKLAILAPDLATIAPRPTFVGERFDPEQQTFAYAVDRSESQGFTLGEIETLMQAGGAELMLV